MRRRRLAGEPGSAQMLPRVQQVFFWLLVVAVLTGLAPWTFDPQVPHPRSWQFVPAAMALLGVAWWRLRHGTTPAWQDLLHAVALGCIVWALGLGPGNGVLYVGAIHRSLYGRLPGLVVAVALQLTSVGLVVAASGNSVTDVAGDVTGVVSVVGAFHLLAAALRSQTRSTARFEALLRGSSDVILITDSDTRVTYASPALPRVFGTASSTGPGPDGPAPDAPATTRATRPDGTGRGDGSRRAEGTGRLLDWIVDEDRVRLEAGIAALLDAGGGSTTVTCRVTDGSGTIRHVEMTVQNAVDAPDVTGLIVNAHDVTARVELAEQLRHQALHDPLTGLANRVLFGDRLEYALSRGDVGTAVLLIDLDGFKAVNDTLGHGAGDQLLAEIGVRLRSCVRPEDVVARLGGDEFAVLLTGAPVDEAFVRVVAGRLIAGINRPARLDAGSVHPAGSVGVALSTGPTSTAGGHHSGPPADQAAEDLLRCADLALYQAKAGGRNRLELYRPDPPTDAPDRGALASLLVAGRPVPQAR